MQRGSLRLSRLLIASLVIVTIGCKKEPLPVEPPVTTVPDTTNHNFAWQRFTFGDNMVSHALVDVAIQNDSDIWAVGYRGTIIHYDGTKWSKMISGSTIHLRDVYGTPDGKTVWASGYDIRSILLKYDGARWQTVWEHTSGGPLMPFNYVATGVFATNTNLWGSGDAGIYCCCWHELLHR